MSASFQIMQAIHEFLKRALSRKCVCNGDKEHIDDYKDGEFDPIMLRANYNTMRSEIKYDYRINFNKPNSIGTLL